MTVDARRSSADPLLVSRRESNGRAFIRRSARIVVVVIVGGAFLQPYRRGGRRDDGFVVVGGRRPPAVDASRREGDRVDDAVVRVAQRVDVAHADLERVVGVVLDDADGVELDFGVRCRRRQIRAVGRERHRVDPAVVAAHAGRRSPDRRQELVVAPLDPQPDGAILRTRREHVAIAPSRRPRHGVHPARVAAKHRDGVVVVVVILWIVGRVGEPTRTVVARRGRRRRLRRLHFSPSSRLSDTH
mmetsp:Transcript_25823/g.103156  ORF Transcript_25823/g.103156 Transcript_25823/m.103156 type:complete len:244 (-) Transcript_25823:1073-1804(-)